MSSSKRVIAVLRKARQGIISESLFPLLFPWPKSFLSAAVSFVNLPWRVPQLLGTALSGVQRGACNVPPLRGPRAT